MDRTKLYLVIQILLTGFNCVAQFSTEEQIEIDSIGLLIKNNKHDTTVASAYVKLSEIMYRSNLDTVLYLSEKAISMANENLARASLNKDEKRAFQITLAQAINNIGAVYYVRDPSLALEHFHESLKIYESIENKVGLAHAYNNIGSIYNFLGNVDEAMEYYQKSLKSGQEIGDKASVATSLNNIGFIHQNKGDIQQALEYYEESLEVSKEIGEKFSIANAYNNIGVLYRDLGNYQKAIEFYNQSLEIHREIDHKQGIASSLSNIGHVYNLQGDILMALEQYQQSLLLREEIGDKSGIATSLYNIGSIHKDMGDINLALKYFHKALNIHEEIGDKNGLALTNNKIGLLMIDLSDLQKALEHHQIALNIFEDLDDKQAIANTLNYIGSIYLDKSKLLLSLEYFQRSLNINNEIEEKIGIAKSLLYIGIVYQRSSNYPDAIKYGNQALNIAHELGVVKELARASELLFDAYKNIGQYKNALEMHELHVEMQDSILNETNTRLVTVKEMGYKHEKELQEERIVVAEQRREEEVRQQKKNLITYVGLVLLISIGLLVYLIMRNKQRKKELLRQKYHNKKLENLDKLKDQFLANTSHELRTPLQGIIGLSESLLEREKEKEKKQELAMISSSGKRLSSLVNSILDFSKLKTHNLTLTLKAVDLRTITDVVLQISQPLIRGKHLTLKNNIDSSIPLVMADEERLYQVLHNLIGNAIKFTDEGTIQVSATDKKEVVEVSVKDTGMGIPEDKIQDVFESFEQADASVTRSQSGTGLGLTITKQLVELHGGNIRIDSIVGKCTHVYFSLPKSSKEKVHREQQMTSRLFHPISDSIEENENESIEDPITFGSKFHVLIVDDEIINQQVLSNYLSRDNFRVNQAMNGKEALKFIQNEKPDVVLLDLMMPNMSGYEVCKEIRKMYMTSELPVIMVTAKDQVTDLVEGLASGANDYLAKPFSKDELLARLNTHLNLYHINSSYLRFIPKEFLKALGHESIIDVELGDQVQGEMTILFSDIRSFTSITEGISAKESFKFLNDVLNYLIPVITTNDGFIDKYIGDAILALFPNNPEDAIISAIEMQKSILKYNRDRGLLGSEELKIGIGIHTGPLMLGTIGVKDRMDGTVISDAVNLASRLEELNKLYKTSMIVSDYSLQGISELNHYSYRYLSNAKVKGKKNAIQIYEFFDGDDEYNKDMKLRTLSIFNEGIKEYYQRRFTRASVMFQEVLDIYTEDETARIFLEKSAHYMVHGVPNNWDGVDVVEKVF